MALTQEDVKELVALTFTDYPLPCKREYNFGPYPECETCAMQKQVVCPHSPFAKGGE